MLPAVLAVAVPAVPVAVAVVSVVVVAWPSSKVPAQQPLHDRVANVSNDRMPRSQSFTAVLAPSSKWKLGLQGSNFFLHALLHMFTFISQSHLPSRLTYTSLWLTSCIVAFCSLSLRLVGFML